MTPTQLAKLETAKHAANRLVEDRGLEHSEEAILDILITVLEALTEQK